MDKRPDRQTTNQRKVVYMDKYVNNHQMAERKPLVQSKQRATYHKSLIIGIGLLSIGLTCIPLVQAISDSKAINEEYAISKQLEEEAMQENLKSQEEFQHMQDPDYLADVARRDYLYSKPGEIVFDIKE